jgi:hypothetical protein
MGLDAGGWRALARTSNRRLGRYQITSSIASASAMCENELDDAFTFGLVIAVVRLSGKATNVAVQEEREFP